MLRLTLPYCAAADAEAELAPANAAPSRHPQSERAAPDSGGAHLLRSWPVLYLKAPNDG
jgi:hypothetical protein